MPAKLSISDMYKIAEERGGKCLSENYDNLETNLKWECEFGHKWFATPRNIKRGAWCHICGGSKKLDIEEMHVLARSNDGKCLSKEYLNSKTPLEWQCSQGHRWFARATHLKNHKTWCPICAGNSKGSINEMKALAKSRGGKCISKKYINKETKLEWECINNHRWFAKPGSVKNNGTWCPKCNINFREEICRTTFEQIFEKKFTKVKPSWLRNPDGNLMELDGFCEEYNLAFEHQGEQHYRLNAYTANRETLIKRTLHDDLKRKLCKQNSIILVIVTYRQDLINLPIFLKKKLKSNFPNVNFEKQIDFNQIYEHKNFVSELKNIAKSLGGKLLSTKYINSNETLEWECKKGHRWFASANSVKNAKSWCKTCAGLDKSTIEDMQRLALTRGGKCLSSEYVDSRTELEWECAKGHRWFAKPNNIKHRTWCRICSNKEKLTIELMQKIAKQKGGKCLSSRYVNIKTNLQWECAKGHKWFATPNNVKNYQQWCRLCSFEKGWLKRKQP